MLQVVTTAYITAECDIPDHKCTLHLYLRYKYTLYLGYTHPADIAILEKALAKHF